MSDRLAVTLALAAKDWQLFWSDRRAALLCFAVPVLLASAFGVVFHKPAGRAAAPKLPVVVVLEGDGPFARRAAADLLASPRLEASILPRVEALARVAERDPAVAVILGPDLEALAAWNPARSAAKPKVAVRYNPLCASEAQWAEGVVSEVILRRAARDGLAAFGAGDAGLPFEVDAAPAEGPEAGFNSYSHSFSGMTLQYLLFWGMESGILLLRERNRSLWARLRAAPVPLGCLLAAKALATAGVALLQVLTTFACGYFLFGVAVAGSPLGFALLALGVSALAASTGLLVAAVGGTEARARSVAILVILAVSMLGGLWIPSFLLPGWARDLALAFPTTWAMRGLDAVTWQGRGLSAALPGALAVAGFAVLFLGLAAAGLTLSEARRRRGTP